MVFSSPTFFFLFLPAAFLVNLLFRRSIRWSNALLLVASLLFYAWGEPVYVLLMIFTTLVNYAAARFMERFPAQRRFWCGAAVVWSLGTLVFFKYTDFLIESINGALGLSLPLPGIALPIGISFFTFQAMSYVLDVYRGDAQLSKNYFDVLLYISLFPQLIAGPIVKYHDVDQQLHARTITIEKTAAGFRRFCFGLAKKVLIANTLAMTADAVYALPMGSVTAPTAWLGAVAYLFQIYFDFSGYSDMAIGLGQAFGFTFKENFNYPYIAQTMQEFWRRWHISLSTWFREYVYIPLGGNRKGRLRTGLNKLTVFLLTGLWHGASWNFAVWGLYHGSFLMLESYGALKPAKWPRALRHAYTLLARWASCSSVRKPWSMRSPSSGACSRPGAFLPLRLRSFPRLYRRFASWRSPLQPSPARLFCTALGNASLRAGLLRNAPFILRRCCLRCFAPSAFPQPPTTRSFISAFKEGRL